MYDMYKLSEKYELSDNWARILLRRVRPDSPRPFPISDNPTLSETCPADGG
jgi:hypothetical protein